MWKQNNAESISSNLKKIMLLDFNMSFKKNKDSKIMILQELMNKNLIILISFGTKKCKIIMLMDKGQREIWPRGI